MINCFIRRGLDMTGTLALRSGKRSLEETRLRQRASLVASRTLRSSCACEVTWLTGMSTVEDEVARMRVTRSRQVMVVFPELLLSICFILDLRKERQAVHTIDVLQSLETEQCFYK